MKKLFGLITALLITVGAMAQDDKSGKVIQPEQATGDKYCVVLQDDGKISVVLNGKDMPGSVTLTNGTVIKSNGTVLSNNGTQIILNDGECVDALGNRMTDEKNKPMKKEDKMSPGAK